MGTQHKLGFMYTEHFSAHQTAVVTDRNWIDPPHQGIIVAFWRSSFKENSARTSHIHFIFCRVFIDVPEKLAAEVWIHPFRRSLIIATGGNQNKQLIWASLITFTTATQVESLKCEEGGVGRQPGGEPQWSGWLICKIFIKQLGKELRKDACFLCTSRGKGRT